MAVAAGCPLQHAGCNFSNGNADVQRVAWAHGGGVADRLPGLIQNNAVAPAEHRHRRQGGKLAVQGHYPMPAQLQVAPHGRREALWLQGLQAAAMDRQAGAHAAHQQRLGRCQARP
jgi:hypothetical protein